jgi:dipeptidyl aminopeptidase/acylaminoacyl peptidase
MLKLMISVLFFPFLLFASDLKVWTPAAMMNFETIIDVQISPDQQFALICCRTLNLVKNAYISKIHRVDLDNPKNTILFTSPEHSSFRPRWSPDGKWISFLSNRTGQIQLYLISSQGGEAITLTDNKYPIYTYKWSPDSTQIAFIAADKKPDNQFKNTIINEQDQYVNRLWLIEIDSEFEAAPLTLVDYYVVGTLDFNLFDESIDWSPDGNYIAFTYTRHSGVDHYHLDANVALFNLKTDEIVNWEKLEHYAACPRFSPDGKKIAYMTCEDAPTYMHNRIIRVVDLVTEDSITLAQTFNQGPSLYDPFFLEWDEEGQHVLILEPKKTKSQLILLPIDGSAAVELPTGELLLRFPSLNFNRKMLGFIMESPSSIAEAYVTNLSDFKPIQISFINKYYLSYPFPKTEIVQWKSEDDLTIEGILTYPLSYDPSKTYPLLVVLHGGPAGCFTEAFMGIQNTYPLLSFSEAGFFIFRPNPRGSNGYGQKFRSANVNDWGGMDFVDIMTGVDSLISQKNIDAERMGVMGWSFGGYMAAWIATHSEKFKAVSIGAAITHLNSMVGTTDLHRYLLSYLGDPQKNFDLYADRSPINHVDHINAPCLIQHGVKDKRVPVGQAFEFYQAMMRQKKTSILLLYPNTSHNFEKPNIAYEAMCANFNWFYKILLKKESLPEDKEEMLKFLQQD